MVLIDVSLETSFRLCPMNFLYTFIVASYVFQVGENNIFFMDKLSKHIFVGLFEGQFFQGYTCNYTARRDLFMKNFNLSKMSEFA